MKSLAILQSKICDKTWIPLSKEAFAETFHRKYVCTMTFRRNALLNGHLDRGILVMELLTWRVCQCAMQWVSDSLPGVRPISDFWTYCFAFQHSKKTRKCEATQSSWINFKLDAPSFCMESSPGSFQDPNMSMIHTHKYMSCGILRLVISLFCFLFLFNSETCQLLLADAGWHAVFG